MGPHPGLQHRQLSTTGNFATWPSVQLDTRNRQMHTSKKLLYNMSSRGIAEERNEGTSTSPHLYFGRGQSSKWLQGKTTSVARLFSACTAMRSFWCQAHTLTDDGKSRCGEKLSGFYRTSERHFKGKGNVQVIKKPISLMCFKTAIIHLMPKRRKKKKRNQRTIRRMLPLIIFILFSTNSSEALQLQTGCSPVRLSVAFCSCRSMKKDRNILSLHTWTTLEIRTNFKILDNPHFTNKQFYLNPSLKKSCFPEWC